MKKLLLFALAAFFGGSVMAQLNQVWLETVTTHDGVTTAPIPAGYTTYRIWADLTDPTDFVSSVNAIAGCHPLDISTTGDFYNDASFGVVLGSQMNPAFVGLFPYLAYDSWATIGASDNTAPEAGSVGNIWTDPANALDGPFGTANGPSLVANDGAWYTTGLSGFGDDVLLAQVTTNGDLSYNLNVQIFDEGDGTAGRIDYVSSGNVGCSSAFEVDGSNLGLIFPAPITGPANDDCANAEAITCGSVTAGTTIDATADAEADAIGFCGTTPGAAGVWYVLSGSNAGDLITASTCDDADYDTKINVYNGGCGTLACVTGNDDGPGCTGFTSSVTWSSDGGDYYILVNGWNAAAIGNFNLTVTCEPAGCTDPLACNFDPLAVADDGSCDYSCLGCTDGAACNFDPAATIDDGSCCLDNCLTLDLFDSFGDGWNGATYTITDLGTATVVATGTMAGSAESVDLCLATGCYNIDVTAGGFPSEISWDLNGTDAGTISGGAPDSQDFGVGGAVCGTFGCTDGAACNFDPAATIDDGSCCLENCIDVVVDGGGFPSEMSWEIYDAADALVAAGGGGDGAFVLCLADGCHRVEMFDSFGDGWNGGSITIDGVSYDVDTAPVGDGNSVGTDYADIGATGTCPVFGCTDVAACNYDPAATDDDGSCIAGPCINDLPSLAYALTENALGTCNGYSGEDMDAATVSGDAGTYNGEDNDLWYSFVPSTSGARIEVNTADFDAVVQLYTAGMTQIELEDVVFVNGSEILNIGSLTAGDSYLVRVSPWIATAGPALFDICVQSIPDTRCDYGPGPYDLCDIFLADWVASDNYNFVMTSDLDGDVSTYNSNGYGTFAPQLKDFSPLPNYGESYTVAINSVFDLTDGNGALESIEVLNDEPCPLVMEDQGLQEVRSSDICANHGPHYLGAYIAVQPFVCGATDYTWEFTRTDVTELPFEHVRGAANAFLQLSSVPGLQPGGVYDVRVKPEFGNGLATSYGAVQCVSIIGPAGLPAEIETPVVVAADADRSDIESGIEAALYPNPNTGEFVNLNVTNIADGTEKVLVDIFDMYGKLVQSEQIAATGSTLNTIVKFNGVASGVYTVKITVNGVVQTERLVIEK